MQPRERDARVASETRSESLAITLASVLVVLSHDGLVGESERVHLRIPRDHLRHAWKKPGQRGALLRGPHLFREATRIKESCHQLPLTRFATMFPQGTVVGLVEPLLLLGGRR
jgi:hypothetical protein